MKKFRDCKIKAKPDLLNMTVPSIAIFVDSKKILDCLVHNIKENLPREDWEKLLDYEVTDERDFFGQQIFELKSPTESICKKGG